MFFINILHKMRNTSEKYFKNTLEKDLYFGEILRRNTSEKPNPLQKHFAEILCRKGLYFAEILCRKGLYFREKPLYF